MILYLIRHAEATKVGGAITRDTDRPLTDRGREDARVMGSALSKLDPTIAAIVTSPLVRAVQTGEIICQLLPGRPAVQPSNAIVPGFRPKRLLEELLATGAGRSIIAVGHQPDLTAFVAYLTADGEEAALALPPCAVLKISIPDGDPSAGAQLLWLLNPDTVRTLNPQV
jgi:phosphohistidine phosphatase